jgi:hypothetical protein
MAKNILLFADGTGNEGGPLPDESRTNVYKLYRATRNGPDTDPSRFPRSYPRSTREEHRHRDQTPTPGKRGAGANTKAVCPTGRPRQPTPAQEVKQEVKSPPQSGPEKSSVPVAAPLTVRVDSRTSMVGLVVVDRINVHGGMHRLSVAGCVLIFCKSRYGQAGTKGGDG